MKILRVFVRRTSYTPTDDMVWIGEPPLPFMIPEHDEVHVSCTFTWDMDAAEELLFQWQAATDKPVRLGGPAYLSPARDFTPGLYVAKNVVFTSRGCNNNCSFCGVRKIEGTLVELPIHPGNIIQDNNFLQCSRQHKDKVFEMLKGQKGIGFRGGLQCNLIDDHFIENIRGLRIRELWMACDTDAQLPAFKEACAKLVKAGFKRDHLKCYSLIGKDMVAEEARNREIYMAGALPFSQLLRDFSRKKTVYSKEWTDFERMPWRWCGARIASIGREETDTDLNCQDQTIFAAMEKGGTMITIIKIAMTVGYVWIGLMAAGVMIAGTGVLTQKAQRGVEKFLKMQAKGIGAAMAICFFMIAAGIAAGLWMSM